MIKVLDANVIKEHWNDLISIFDNSNFYQSYENYLINSFGKKKCELYVEYDNDSPLIAAMVIIDECSVTIPFGPLYNKSVTENRILSFLYYIKKRYNLPLEFSLNSKDFNRYLNIVNNFKEVWDFSTILLELQDIDILKLDFSTNRKRIIKKCLIELQDAIINTDKENAKIFYEMYCKRLAETKGIVDFTYEELVHILNIPNIKLNLCQKGNDYLAGIVTYSFNDTLINRYNCTDSRFLRLNPNSFLDYSIIKASTLSKKYKYYDFSGYVLGDNLDTKVANLNRYKLSYGPKKIESYKWYNL